MPPEKPQVTARPPSPASPTSPTPAGVEEAFRAALARDAQVTPPDMPAPPRLAVSADPDAPHGRAEDGTPLMPYGPRKDGKPALKPAGPGRGHKGDKPRETTAAPAAAAAASGKDSGPDYRADLSGLGMMLWMGGAMLPAAQPYAHVWKQSLPGQVNAWNTAAKQNITVRGWVEKLSGEGSWAWVFPVMATSGSFLASCLALSKNTPEAQAARAELAKACQADFTAYMDAQMAAMTELEQEMAL